MISHQRRLDHFATQQHRCADQQRRPGSRGNEKVKREFHEAGIEQAGSEVSWQTCARQKAAQRNRGHAATLKPCGTSFYIGLAHEPLQRCVAQNGSADKSPGKEQQNIADENSYQTGQRSEDETDSSFGGQNAGPDAG